MPISTRCVVVPPAVVTAKGEHLAEESYFASA